MHPGGPLSLVPPPGQRLALQRPCAARSSLCGPPPAFTPAMGRLFLPASPFLQIPCLLGSWLGLPPVGWLGRAGLVGRGPGDTGRGKQMQKGTWRHVVTVARAAGAEEGLSGDARPRRGPGWFPGAREACTHARVPCTRESAGNVFGHVYVSGFSPSSAPPPTPEKRERRVGTPCPWAADSPPRTGGISTRPVHPRGKGRVGGREDGKGLCGSLGDGSWEGPRGVWKTEGAVGGR